FQAFDRRLFLRACWPACTKPFLQASINSDFVNLPSLSGSAACMLVTYGPALSYVSVSLLPAAFDQTAPHCSRPALHPVGQKADHPPLSREPGRPLQQRRIRYSAARLPLSK